MSRHLVVLGGGITGLSAAWEARRRGWSVTVIDSADRFGGKLLSSDFLGRRIDEGADAFLRRVPQGLELCAELGLDDLVSPAATSACVWVGGELRRIPGGLVLGVPSRFDELAGSGILTPEGLARARAEVDRRGAALAGDAGVGDVIREHYGDEVADHLVGPLLGGINAGDPDRLSIDAGVPQLAAAAHADASMTRALAATPAGAPGEPVFSTPRAGMGVLAETLAAALADGGAHMLSGREVVGLEPDGDGWSVTTASGGVGADAVIVSVPSGVAAALLSGLCPTAARHLAGIETSSVALVTLGYSLADVPRPLDASGFLVPRDAGLTLTAASWGSSKWAHWADGRHALLRVSAGHRNDPGPAGWADDRLLEALGRDLERTMGITAAPVATRITRWRDGFPQYDVGHVGRVAAIDRAIEDDCPGLIVTGAAHRGLGIPACIAQGREAVARLADRAEQ